MRRPADGRGHRAVQGALAVEIDILELIAIYPITDDVVIAVIIDRPPGGAALAGDDPGGDPAVLRFARGFTPEMKADIVDFRRGFPS